MEKLQVNIEYTMSILNTGKEKKLTSNYKLINKILVSGTKRGINQNSNAEVDYIKNQNCF